MSFEQTIEINHNFKFTVNGNRIILRLNYSKVTLKQNQRQHFNPREEFKVA